MWRRVAIGIGGLLLGGAFYLLTVDTTDLPELYVLAGVALLCGIAFEVSREQAFEEAALRPALLARAWRAAVRVPRDIAIVSWEALKQLVAPKRSRGTFRAVRFRDRSSASPSRDAARRALAEALGSLAPNTIVIGVDREHDLLLVHQLRRRGDQDDLDVLGLR
jgi:hypothetical protein